MLIIKQCQFYGGQLPVSRSYAIHKMSFLTKLQTIDNGLINFIANKMNPSEIEKLSTKYSIEDNFSFTKKFHKIIHENFRQDINAQNVH